MVSLYMKSAIIWGIVRWKFIDVSEEYATTIPRSKGGSGKKQGDLFCHVLLAGFMLGLLFGRENGGSLFFRNVGELIAD